MKWFKRYEPVKWVDPPPPTPPKPVTTYSVVWPSGWFGWRWDVGTGIMLPEAYSWRPTLAGALRAANRERDRAVVRRTPELSPKWSISHFIPSVIIETRAGTRLPR